MGSKNWRVKEFPNKKEKRAKHKQREKRNEKKRNQRKLKLAAKETNIFVLRYTHFLRLWQNEIA